MEKKDLASVNLKLKGQVRTRMNFLEQNRDFNSRFCLYLLSRLIASEITEKKMVFGEVLMMTRLYRKICYLFKCTI